PSPFTSPSSARGASRCADRHTGSLSITIFARLGAFSWKDTIPLTWPVPSCSAHTALARTGGYDGADVTAVIADASAVRRSNMVTKRTAKIINQTILFTLAFEPLT